nr:hypothetical protein [Thermoguttaceae bacterium]
MKTNLCRRKLFLESLEERELLAVTAGWTEPAAHLAAPMTTGDLIPTPGIYVMNLNSNPGATYTIYLDFDGHVITDSYWNYTYTGGADIVIPRFNLDGNAEKESFSLEEEAAIYRIWQIVSEDFMPFDVNVTTVEPSSDAFLNCLAQRAAFGGDSEWVRSEGPIGIARRDSFSISGDLPCFVFTDPILKYFASDTCRGVAKMGNTASHELGHTFGLTHKGMGDILDEREYDYYDGRNDWGPIMGGGNMELMQWSKGEYDGANSTLDELQVISSKIDYRVDDYADSFDGAAVLSISGGAGEIAGIIERNTDVDCFVFESDGSDLHFTIGGIQGVTNLDTLVKVYSEDRELIAVYDPTDRLDVEFVFSQQAGTYYITVDGTGLDTGKTGIYSDYGSLGAYTVRALGRDYTPPVTETYIVTTLDDVVADDGLLSLREAVSLADDDAVILFAPLLIGGTIHLTEGEILINRAVTIDASSVGGITIDADGKSRIFQVLFGGGLSSSPVKLIDLTITGGKSDYGAGIYCCYGVTTLTNCTISGNVASGEGGGIYNTGTVTLIDCTVSGNTADSGGGMYGLCAKTTAIDCTISNNIAKRGGGGGIESSIGTLALTGCSVSGNRAKDCGGEDGGGGIFIFGGQLTATDCFITENTSDGIGGGIFNSGGVVKDQLKTTRGAATLTRCTISGNTAASLGGGIFTGSGYTDNYNWMTLTDCIISKNTSDKGGGIMNYRGTLTAVGCTISDNTAKTYGGGFNNNREGKAILLNTVISGNTAETTGGGIHNATTTLELTIVNCTVSGNTASDGGGILNNNGAALTLTNTIVALNYSPAGTEIDGGYSGDRNIVGSDPGFAAAPVFEDGVLINAEALDLSLAAGSAAIDAGTNDAVVTETDLAGNPRIVGGVVDLGAYEYLSSTALDAPAILTGVGGRYVSGGANRHRIDWNAVENAAGYELSYSADGGNTWVSIQTAETSAVVGGLVYGADVSYRVRALGTGSFENSDWSASASFNVCPMDINGDGDISGSDRTILAGAWLAEAGDEAYRPYADINGDGDISNTDRAYVSGNWLAEAGDDGLNYPRAAAADAALAEY